MTRVATAIFRNQLYDHIQNLPFSFHDHSQTGQLISRCIEDVRSIQAFTGSSLIELVRLILLLVGTLYLLFSQNARLAAIALLPLIPLALMTTSFGQRITGLFWAVDQSCGSNLRPGRAILPAARESENLDGMQFTGWVRSKAKA